MPLRRTLASENIYSSPSCLNSSTDFFSLYWVGCDQLWLSRSKNQCIQQKPFPSASFHSTKYYLHSFPQHKILSARLRMCPATPLHVMETDHSWPATLGLQYRLQLLHYRAAFNELHFLKNFISTWLSPNCLKNTSCIVLSPLIWQSQEQLLKNRTFFRGGLLV